MTKKELAEILEARKLQLGITNAQISRRLKKSDKYMTDYLSRLRNGIEKNVNLDTLQPILAVLKMEIVIKNRRK